MQCRILYGRQAVRGRSCFTEVAEQCPPSSVPVDNSDLCVRNAGFFMVDKQCVTCTAGYYCPGGHTDASSSRRRVLSETNYSGGDIEPCPLNSQSISGADSGTVYLCDSGYSCAQPASLGRTRQLSATSWTANRVRRTRTAPPYTNARRAQSPRSRHRAARRRRAVSLHANQGTTRVQN